MMTIEIGRERRYVGKQMIGFTLVSGEVVDLSVMTELLAASGITPDGWNRITLGASTAIWGYLEDGSRVTLWEGENDLCTMGTLALASILESLAADPVRQAAVDRIARDLATGDIDDITLFIGRTSGSDDFGMSSSMTIQDVER